MEVFFAKGDWVVMAALSAIHLIISKHISIVIGADSWLRPERSHTAGSSLELGLVALLGLVTGVGTLVVGEVEGSVPCEGEGNAVSCVTTS
jgi:hypothetical protein